MMTNYLNPSMYMFWFTVGAPFLVRSSRLTEGIWYPRIMKLLGIFLMGFSLVFVKDGLGYFGLI